MTRAAYVIEAWVGLDCIGFRRFARPSTARLQALDYIASGADRIYIRATGDTHGLMADWTPGRGWTSGDDRFDFLRDEQ